MTLEIMLPYYGRFSFARSAIESILGQDDPNWFCTVVDDAFPGHEMEEFVLATGDPRMRYVRNSENLGVAGNFNRCLQISRGSHTVLMGSDDLLGTHYVRTLRQAIRAFPNAAAISPDVSVVDEYSVRSRPLEDRVKKWLRPRGLRVVGSQSCAARLLIGDYLYFPAIAWRTDRIRMGFREQYQVVMDIELLMRLLCSGGVIVLLPETAFFYRRHSQSVSSSLVAAGARFAEDREFSRAAESMCRKEGWPVAALMAKLRLTGRLHAATVLAQSVRRRDRASALSAVRHILG